MRKQLQKTCWLTLVVLLALTLPALADTMEMKDGRVLKGKFMGGTETQVRFQAEGQVDLYPLEQIVSITFGETRPQPDDPGEAPPRGPDAQNEGLTVPAGTRIMVRMIDSVDSDKNHVGDKFRASLEENLVAGDVIVAPKGADVYGRLAEAKEAGHISGKSELRLELTDISINGRLQPIMTGDYDVAGKSRGSNTAKKVGGGAVAGAVIGAIAGGGKGAVIGSGVGAGAGAAVQVFTKGQQVKVPSETLLEFRIEQPFTVQPAPR